MFCFAYAIVRHPTGLKLGIVDLEVDSNQFCFDYLDSTNFTFSNSSCYFENLSCHFVNEIPESIAIKIFYNSFDDALRDAKAGLTSGFVTVSSNFTNAMTQRKIDWQPLNKIQPDADIIQVYLDQTDPVVTSFFKHRLFKAFERFNKKVLQHCDLNENLEDSPINLKDGLIYGTFEDDYTITMIPGMFAQLSINLHFKLFVSFSPPIQNDFFADITTFSLY